MSEVIKHLADFDSEKRYQAVVVSSDRITPEGTGEEVRELVLDVGRPDFPFQIGQSIGVVVPGPAEFGKQHHFRLYSVADLPERAESGRPRIKIAVRRCSYIDPYSGEEFAGVASNYLCDLAPGDSVLMTGPFGIVFEVPDELDANLILIGSGTGIAPFRAFVKHIYRDVPDFRGRVWLFYGAQSGLEMLYMNDEKNDFTQYYDEETFQAFKALSARPGWSDAIAWDTALQERGEELWAMLSDAKTYVYVAGLEKMLGELDAVFATLAGSPEKWSRRKAELMAGRRWVQLVY
jgi:ferredoxin--NADP+ reductase